MPNTTTRRSGLTVLNHTQYDTDDLVALLDVLENALVRGGKKKKPQVSPWAPNATIALRDYTGKATTRTRISRRVWEEQRVVVKAGHGPIAGVVRAVKPDKLYDNPIEALVNSGEEVKTVPDAFIFQFIEAAANAYRFATVGDIESAYSAAKNRGLKVRINDSRALPAVRDTQVEQRRKARRPLMKVQNRLRGMHHDAKEIVGMLNAFEGAGWTEMEAFPEVHAGLKELDRFLAGLSHLRDSVDSAINSLRAPELVKESDDGKDL